MRLSKRGWNNVLIFASAFMILLFNGAHYKLLNRDSEPLDSSVFSVLPEQSVVLTLDMPGVSVQRYGKSWRSEPDSGLSETQMQQLVSAWQHLQGSELSQVEMSIYQQELDRAPDHVIVVWLAGSDKPIAIQLFQLKDALLALWGEQQIWLKLPFDAASSLLPPTNA